MRAELIMLGLLLVTQPSSAEVNIGLSLQFYPELVPVPNYPVYYAPGVASNYFYYDGMYWVYQRNDWYTSSWYNGPWRRVSPAGVPAYLLRVPVRYYRQAPAYFRGWRADEPPRWGAHWGNTWQQQRQGWDRWDRNAVPVRPPLPVYQQQYSGDRYPHTAQQRELQRQNFHYQPNDPLVRQQYPALRVRAAPAIPAPGVQQERAWPQTKRPEQRDPERAVAPTAGVQRFPPVNAPPPLVNQPPQIHPPRQLAPREPPLPNTRSQTAPPQARQPEAPARPGSRADKERDRPRGEERGLDRKNER